MKTALLVLTLVQTLLLAAQHSLTITIEDIRSEEGVLYLAIYQNSDTWLNESATFRQQIVAPKKGTMTLSFSNIPAGNYAVSVLHDMNRDKELNTNWLGMPAEAYGFSNNPGFMMRAPRFSECVFSAGPGSAITIDLVHW